jgi:hypothetical protein
VQFFRQVIMKIQFLWLAVFLCLSFSTGCTAPPKTSISQGLSETPAAFATSTIEPATAASPEAADIPSPDRGGEVVLSPVLTMNAQRAAHSATLLAGGKVLLAGGFRQQGMAEIPISSAEIYDPAINRFTPVGELNEARSGHTATLLPDGQVLIAGGWGEKGRTATAELYDPQTGQFSYTASLAAPRAGMTATMLQDGLVLFAGGDSARITPQLAAEIYDPTTHTFVLAGSLQHGRSAHTAALLQDGSVLLVGGRTSDNTVLASAEIFDPANWNFTLTGSLNGARHKHAAVRLQDGNVLVLGGSNQDDWKGMHTSAEIYDQTSGKFTSTADLNWPRFKLADAAVLLDDGGVLVGGGSRHVELFDPDKQHFEVSATLDDDYFFAVLTRLQDGRVLISGGYNANIEPSDKAWIYQSSSLSAASQGAPACPASEPEWVKPPEDAAVQGTPGYGYYFVNTDRTLWASAWWGEEDVPLQAGEKGNKVGWFRPAGVELEITGRRLDGKSPPLEAHIPCCYPTRFQATGLIFPTAGCWEVDAKAGDHELTIGVWVERNPRE